MRSTFGTGSIFIRATNVTLLSVIASFLRISLPTCIRLYLWEIAYVHQDASKTFYSLISWDYATEIAIWCQLPQTSVKLDSLKLYSFQLVSHIYARAWPRIMSANVECSSRPASNGSNVLQKYLSFIYRLPILDKSVFTSLISFIFIFKFFKSLTKSASGKFCKPAEPWNILYASCRLRFPELKQIRR